VELTMKPAVYPSDWMLRNEPPPLADFGRRLLAEGDSWFTIGTLNLAAASNLVFQLEFTHSTVIVNCAYPGDTLDHMTDSVDDPQFDALLRKPRFASRWEAVLLSGGGNDLIDAAQHLSVNRDGSPAPLASRLLLTPTEAAVHKPGDNSPERFISEEGWALLAGYLVASVSELVRRRDEGPSRGRPLIMHTYSIPTVWRCGTVGSADGWLFKAFNDYGIAQADRQPLANALFGRLRQLLLGLAHDSGQPQALPDVHVFDSAGAVALDAPDPAATGESGDWVNEIHPSPGGYKKLGRAFGPYIEAVLAQYP
jgi:hypothetical protein